MGSTKRLRRHAKELLKFRKASAYEKSKILNKNFKNPDFVKCICECCKNILNGNVPLSEKQKTVLKRKRYNLRRLVSTKTPISKKKKIIQSGGFLGAILGPVASILGGLLGNVFNN